jgi:hypothetical protein
VGFLDSVRVDKLSSISSSIVVVIYDVFVRHMLLTNSLECSRDTPYLSMDRKRSIKHIVVLRSIVAVTYWYPPLGYLLDKYR